MLALITFNLRQINSGGFGSQSSFMAIKLLKVAIHSFKKRVYERFTFKSMEVINLQDTWQIVHKGNEQFPLHEAYYYFEMYSSRCLNVHWRGRHMQIMAPGILFPPSMRSLFQPKHVENHIAQPSGVTLSAIIKVFAMNTKSKSRKCAAPERMNK